MLSLKELRSACALSFNVSPTFRALLAASIFYEKSELAEILLNADFTLSQFQQILTVTDTPDPNEDSLIILTILRSNEPTILDLLLTLCESIVKLKSELKKAGLNIDALIEYLKRKTTNKNKLMLDNIVPNNSNTLTHLSKLRRN
jgi:hypothetical protein